jgi:hypothetical protein
MESRTNSKEGNVSEVTHTKKEREAIADAYHHVGRLLDRVNRAGYAWQDAYKLERKERSSMPAAQALCVESFLQGYTTRTSAATVWYFSTGCGIALQLGAMIREEHKRDRKAGREVYPEKVRVKMLRAAYDAHQAYIMRRLDALK